MNTEIVSAFALDVKTGLTAKKKFISSRYFYDETGDKIFQSIMRMKEYYPTACEYETFTMQKEEILRELLSYGSEFNLIEFGAGDGYKTKVLMEYFLEKNVRFKYLPIDISDNAIASLENDLKNTLPGLNVEGFQGEYFEALQKLNELDGSRKVILFLGSNIGNFSYDQSIDFLKKLRSNMSPNDQVLIGFDLKKDPRIILKAYDDPTGITKAFNLNLLARINRELGGNFNLEHFDHFPLYEPLTGTTKSYLVSKKKQVVFIEELEMEFTFEPWETIHTEISQKFDQNMVHQMASEADFEVTTHFFDCKHYYLNALWTPKI